MISFHFDRLWYYSGLCRPQSYTQPPFDEMVIFESLNPGRPREQGSLQHVCNELGEAYQRSKRTMPGKLSTMEALAKQRWKEGLQHQPGPISSPLETRLVEPVF